MAFLLFCGLVCNFFVKRVDKRYWMSEAELARERVLQHEGAELAARGGFGVLGALAWRAVAIAFCVGLLIALQKAAALF